MKHKLITQKFSEGLNGQGTCSVTGPNSLVEGCINAVKDTVQDPIGGKVEAIGAALAGRKGGIAGIKAALTMIATENAIICAAGAINTATDNCEATHKPYKSSMITNSNNATEIKPLELLKPEPIIKPIEIEPFKLTEIKSIELPKPEPIIKPIEIEPFKPTEIKSIELPKPESIIKPIEIEPFKPTEIKSIELSKPEPIEPLKDLNTNFSGSSLLDSNKQNNPLAIPTPSNSSQISSAGSDLNSNISEINSLLLGAQNNTIDSSMNLALLKLLGTSNIDLTGVTIPDLHQ